MKSVLGHLQRLQYEDALEQREAQGYDPLGGLFSAVFKTVQQGEEGGHPADGQQQEPTQEHTPPGQPAVCCTLLLLLLPSYYWRTVGGSKRGSLNI